MPTSRLPTRRYLPTADPYYISPVEKKKLLADIPDAGLRMNGGYRAYARRRPPRSMGAWPLQLGMCARPLPWGLYQRGRERNSQGRVRAVLFWQRVCGGPLGGLAKSEGVRHQRLEWVGGGPVGTLNVAVAKPALSARLAPYLSEFTVGSTLKLSMGSYGEIIESGGTGLVARVGGAEADAWADCPARPKGASALASTLALLAEPKIARRPSVSVCSTCSTCSLGTRGCAKIPFFSRPMNCASPASWTRTRGSIEEVFDNPDFDGDGRSRLYQANQSRAVLALAAGYAAARGGLSGQAPANGGWQLGPGVQFQVWDADSAAAGRRRRVLAGGLVCRPALDCRWAGEAAVQRSALPLARFVLSSMQIRLLETSLAMRGGLLPGIAKGTAISVMFFRLSLV